MADHSTLQVRYGTDGVHMHGGNPHLSAVIEGELRIALKGLQRILNEIELDEGPINSDDSDRNTLMFARRMIAERHHRFLYFNSNLFADPAWDIMLELFVAGLENRKVPVTTLCLRSNIPDTTLLRWVKTLCQRNLTVRHKDMSDKRRVLVALTSHGYESMQHYIDGEMAVSTKTWGRAQHWNAADPDNKDR